jgi:hypothetical protein
MDRRGFLIHTARAGSVLLILPAGWAMSGCANNENVTTVAVAVGPTLRFRSDIAQNHTHDFSLITADLTGPRVNGVSGPTTTTLGHFHFVILSAAELAQIQFGGTINRETTVVDGHAHVFSLSLATAQEGTMQSPGGLDMAPSMTGTSTGVGGY